jgi:molybdate transport system permease protein
MEFTPEIFETLFLTLKLAFMTTLLLLLVGIPLAYWTAFSRSRLRPVLETLVSLPLVLPPTVLGFYLIVALSPSTIIGTFLESVFDIRLVFSFEGLVLGSLIYSLPFMVQPLRAGFNSIPPTLAEASYTLGKSKFETLMKVLLPNMKPSLVTGIVLTFAHTVGEFGVVLMIGGNIPGITRVVSIAIYNNVETLQYGAANTYAIILVVLSFCLLLPVSIYNTRGRNESRR